MSVRTVRFRLLILIVATCSLTLWARSGSGASDQTKSLGSRAEIVRKGAVLERSRQWLDAIQYYEEAIKQFPTDDDVKLGLRRAKIHFGIDRRYADTSFNSTLLTTPRSQLMALMDDVLFKIKSHFVQELSLTWLVAHGTESFYYALANESFLKHNFPTPHSEAERIDRARRIQQMRTILRDEYWNKPIAGREAAFQTISRATDTAERILGISGRCVVMEYVFGFCNSLDDYSNFLTPERLTDLYDMIDGEFVGIGIEMKAETGKGLLLVNVLPNSPAEEGGARSGDHIVSIEGVDCRNMSTDEAATRLRGPSGSRVRLELVGLAPADVRKATLTRRQVQVKSIPVARIIDHEYGIGYLKMTGFQKSSPAEMDEALARLNRQGLRALIWDVRGNPGGLLTAAVEVLDRFIDEGPLVSTRGRTRDQNWTYKAHHAHTSKIPIILLTDENSASASEIVAGAIRDHHRGLVVGRKTYGKWSVQSIFSIRDATGLRLTTAKFYSPDGHTFGHVGLQPDVLVERKPDQQMQTTLYRANRDISISQDPDVQKGREILRRQLSSS